VHWSRGGLGLAMLATAITLPSEVSAQFAQRPDPVRPILTVSASAEVELVPDRATLGVAVETRGRTAAEAASANARLQTAVIDAIKAAGVPAAQIRTAALAVSPEYQYPEGGGRPTVVGYQATNRVTVEVREIARTGAIIDAVLAKGATNVDGPRFSASDPSPARKAALEQAVRKARAEAEAVAAAAGVRLGGVLEISTDEAPVEVQAEAAMMRVRAMSAAQATPIESGTLTVRASVTLKFLILGQ
jgi:uncharacterized protein YggE